MAWGDYDSDGDLDILISGCAAGAGSGGLSCTNVTAKVYRNDGGGVFTDIGAGLTGVEYSSVAWGDYDNDGDLDILLSGNASPQCCLYFITKVYRNDGSDNFTDINAALRGVLWSSVAWGDYDSDGDLDILLTGEGGNNCAKVYRNDGGGVFTDINATLTGVVQSSVAWGDYDNDGDLDILLTGNAWGPPFIAKVYRNDGGGVFTDINAALTGVSFGSVTWGDYDNDGDLDILLTGDNDSTECTTKIYRNDVTTTNTVPASPTGLKGLFSWDASSDAQTQAAGLSYNLRVGTTPSGSQIVSPMANTTSGYRRVPHLGNAGHRLTATIKNLTPGATYYWSVQAIDAAWAASPFASEASFQLHIVYLPLVMRNCPGGSCEVEPNNSYLEATGPLQSGKDYYGYPNDLKDYFSFYMDTPGQIHITLNNHTGGDVQLQLFYQIATEDTRVAWDWNSPFEISYNGAAGWYYIYIYTGSNYNTNTPYTLRVTYP